MTKGIAYLPSLPRGHWEQGTFYFLLFNVPDNERGIIQNPNYQFYTDKGKLKHMMINLDKNTEKFIYKCFELRTFFNA